MKLTDLRIKNAAADTKAYKLRGEYGLFLLVTPTGGKLWRWKYRRLKKPSPRKFP